MIFPSTSITLSLKNVSDTLSTQEITIAAEAAELMTAFGGK